MGAIIFNQKISNIRANNQNIVTEQKLLRSQMTPHFIFNSLSVLQGMILNKEEKNSISYLSEFSKLLRTILENSRHKLVPLSKELQTVDSYIKLQNLTLEHPYNYNLELDPSIDIASLNVPPMLIQPFIENIIEHAFTDLSQTKEINLSLQVKQNQLECLISDNGIGINTETKKNNKNKDSLATAITTDRLKMLSKDFKSKGSIKVENRLQYGEKGTLVTLSIPFQKDKK